MKKLDEQIRLNIDSFDRFEPDPGHLKRFEKKLILHKNKTTRWIIFRYAASVSILAVISALFMLNYSFIENLAGNNNKMPEEIEDAQLYFLSLIDNKVETIKKLDPQFQFEELELETAPNQQLKNEFKMIPSNQKLFNALIIQYQSKIDILDKIIDNLNNIKPLKNNHHENFSI